MSRLCPRALFALLFKTPLSSLPSPIYQFDSNLLEYPLPSHISIIKGDDIVGCLGPCCSPSIWQNLSLHPPTPCPTFHRTDIWTPYPHQQHTIAQLLNYADRLDRLEAGHLTHFEHTLACAVESNLELFGKGPIHGLPNFEVTLSRLGDSLCALLFGPLVHSLDYAFENSTHPDGRPNDDALTGWLASAKHIRISRNLLEARGRFARWTWAQRAYHALEVLLHELVHAFFEQNACEGGCYHGGGSSEHKQRYLCGFLTERLYFSTHRFEYRGTKVVSSRLMGHGVAFQSVGRKVQRAVESLFELEDVCVNVDRGHCGECCGSGACVSHATDGAYERRVMLAGWLDSGKPCECGVCSFRARTGGLFGVLRKGGGGGGGGSRRKRRREEERGKRCAPRDAQTRSRGEYRLLE